MAASTYDFTPGSVPFQFQPTLDSQVYNVVVTWNLFGRRWYVNVYAVDGTLVVALPLVGSPQDHDINLVGGYFDSKIVYRASSRQFEVSP